MARLLYVKIYTFSDRQRKEYLDTIFEYSRTNALTPMTPMTSTFSELVYNMLNLVLYYSIERINSTQKEQIVTIPFKRNAVLDECSTVGPRKPSLRLQRTKPKENPELYDTVRIYDTLNGSWNTYYQIRPEVGKTKENQLEDGVETYHCAFCNYYDSIQEDMEDHYYHNHDKELAAYPGYLSRQIELLMTNGDKSDGNFNKRYRTWPNVLDCLGT